MKQIGFIQERPVITVWLPSLMIIVRTLISSIRDIPAASDPMTHVLELFCVPPTTFLSHSQVAFQDSYEADFIFLSCLSSN